MPKSAGLVATVFSPPERDLLGADEVRVEASRVVVIASYKGRTEHQVTTAFGAREILKSATAPLGAKKPPTKERIVSMVDHEGATWIAGEKGFVAREGGKPITLPDAGKPGRDDPPPIARLLVVGGTLYVLGYGLWRIEKGKAHLELASKKARFEGLVLTPKGTRVAAGCDSLLCRAENGKAWEQRPKEEVPWPYSALVGLGDALLLVAYGPAPLRVSRDDGRSFQPIAIVDTHGKKIQPREFAKRGGFHCAALDGKGAAFVAGGGGALVRVATDGLGKWGKGAKKAPTAEARLAAFERKHGFVVTDAAYRKFLVSGKGKPRASKQVREVYGLEALELGTHAFWEPKLFVHAYPIAESRSGDPIVQVASGRYAGKVFLTNHEGYHELVQPLLRAKKALTTDQLFDRLTKKNLDVLVYLGDRFGAF